MTNFRKLNVVDVESTCWRNGKAPNGQVSEIIQIGICQYNTKQREITKSDSYLIKPEKSYVSDYCTDLTGLTEEQVMGYGKDFRHVIKNVKHDYGLQKRPWASWGNYDKQMFKKERYRRNMKKFFNDTHVNIPGIISIIRGTKSKMGLKKALTYFGIKQFGNYHDGEHDAINAAKLFHHFIDQLNQYIVSH